MTSHIIILQVTDAPIKELFDFTKVYLSPGESQEAVLVARNQSFTTVDTNVSL